MIPGNTLVVVYAGKVSSQSCAHDVARYRATCPYHQHLLEGPAPTRARRKRVAVVKLFGARLADMETIMPPLFTSDCLHLPGGFLRGAFKVQATQCVLFPPLSHEQLQRMVAVVAVG